MLSSICRSRPASPIRLAGTSGVTSHASSRPFSAARSASSLAASPTVSRRSNAAYVEVEPLRFDLREIEDVVHDLEQRLGRRLHGREVVLLFGREPGAERERRHAENRVERRADLVAHVRQERALGGGRVLGAALRGLELLHQLRQPRGLILELGVGQPRSRA